MGVSVKNSGIIFDQNYDVFSSTDDGDLNILGAAGQSNGTGVFDRSGTHELMGKPESEFPIYPEGGPHKHGDDGGIFSPSSLNDTSSVPSEILVDGSLEPGDVDGYTVNLVAGQSYVFSVYGSGENALPDTYLYVLDETGSTILGQDDDGGAGVNSLITYTADYTGEHVIGVTGFSADQEGDYTLDLLNAPDTDLVPDTFAGAPLIPTEGVSYGYINGGPEGPYPGYSEVDTYAIQIEGGQLFSVEVAGGADYASSFIDLPPGELDTIIQLYDSEGNFVAGNDDINFLSGDISSGLSFLAEESGTYYLDVLAYPNLTTGEFQEGGYSITTSSTDIGDLDPLESLIWDNAENVPFDSTNTAYVYFAEAGEDFGEGGASFGWNEFEKAQVMDALEEYSKILGTNYEVTDNAEDATFRLITTTSTQFGAYFYPQDPAYGDAQGIGAFNVDSGAWNFDEQQSLLKGGFAYGVILHEFGHAHGLSHPHDQGGGSDVMLGVTAAQDSLGVYDLNQGVYTVMSYNDAWQNHPDGPTPFTVDNVDSGWSGTLSAFDIAALQERYGVNNPYAEDDTVYRLQDSNDVGAYYETIWDTDGNDTIAYSGQKDAQIDLMAATIDYSPTGGGVVSFVDGVFGGYTIAEGVVIENASGGGGDDILLGNEADNTLNGRAGEDAVLGRGGDDTLISGAGDDYLVGGDGNDVMIGGAGADEFAFDASDGTDIVTDFAVDHDSVTLSDEGESYMMFDNGFDSYLIYGDTMVIFQNAILSDSDIGYATGAEVA